MHNSDKQNNGLSKIQQYVMHLRYRLAPYQFEGINPPQYLLNELKIAERLVRIELRVFEKFRQKIEI